MRLIYLIVFLLLQNTNALAEVYTVTAYCACKKCCGPNAKGLTASGKTVKVGMIACNHLKFGTKVIIGGQTYTVEDRGAKRLFGDFKDIKRRIDIYFQTHQQALNFGIKKMEVTI